MSRSLFVSIPKVATRATKRFSDISSPNIGDLSARVDPGVERSYREAMFGPGPGPAIERIDRFAFYDRARAAFAVVMTGEAAKYGNIILKKGVTPASPSFRSPKNQF